ncbi:hypothetical protein [Streptomyces sp. NPDC029674]|uniref:hypothetical protein n=1 Tax=Streptomyces sp. NPDC029674 TaxID=3365297 RepID=UPI00384FA088
MGPTAGEGVPAPGPGSTVEAAESADEEAGVPPRLPYDNGYSIAQHLIRKMSDDELDTMLTLLNKHQQQRNAVSTDV